MPLGHAAQVQPRRPPRLQIGARGTLGQRVRRAALLPNDTLAIANLKFTVKFGADLEKEEAAAKEKARQEAVAQLRRNALPDVYPESKTPRSG